MPEDAGIHPGSWLGDAAEEFKKLPTWGKFAIGGVGILVVVLAIRARQSAALSTSGNLPATSSAPGSSSPFPMVGNVPLLPSGTNPIYDPSGNLVGYQSGSQAPGGPTAPPIIGGQNQPPSNPPLQGGNPPSQGPAPSPWTALIPKGQYNGPQGSIAPGTKYTWNGQIYQIGQGSNGIVWGVPVSQGQTLSNTAWSNTPIAIGQKQVLYGSGSGPTSNYMEDPFVYHRAGQPHISSAHRGVR